MLERFVNGQDVFLFQPTGLKKFKFLGSRMSDNKVNKETLSTYALHCFTHIELKGQNSQANRNITFHKYSNKVLFFNELGHR